MKKLIAWLAMTPFILIMMSPVAMAYITASGCDTSISSCSDEDTTASGCDPSIQTCSNEEENSISTEGNSPSSSSSPTPSSPNTSEASAPSAPLPGVASLNECGGDQQLADVIKETMHADGTVIVTEFFEPVGDLDQVVTQGNITVSQVFWKFTCKTGEVHDWNPDNRTEIISTATTEKPFNKEAIAVSGYVPYNGGQCPDDAQCSLVQLIVAQSGSGLLKLYIGLIYRWTASIVGIVAVLVIVVSGIQISVDQGSGENLTAAKTRIMQSLAGIVILFLSALILYTINPTFFTK